MEKQLKLTIDLVPRTCWYSSLYRQMPRSKWDRIRKQAYADAEHVCQICSAEARIQCHEIWEYDENKLIQKLKGFVALCSKCHDIKHFGRSQMRAARGEIDLDALIDHFCKVNNVSSEVFSSHKTEAFKTWRARSAKKWKTDLGKWSSYVSS